MWMKHSGVHSWQLTSDVHRLILSSLTKSKVPGGFCVPSEQALAGRGCMSPLWAVLSSTSLWHMRQPCSHCTSETIVSSAQSSLTGSLMWSRALSHGLDVMGGVLLRLLPQKKEVLRNRALVNCISALMYMVLGDSDFLTCCVSWGRWGWKTSSLTHVTWWDRRDPSPVQ